VTPFPGEDFQMFERDLPGKKTAEFNADSVVSQLPLETCDTINGAWGFNATDRKWKDPRDLLHELVRAAGMNANLLLNIGPQPNGQIQPEQAERLRRMGAWLKKYGDSVYGTRGGPVAPRPWGVTTKKGNTVYVHVLDWPDGQLVIPALGGQVHAARALTTGRAVKYEALKDGSLLFELPTTARDDDDTVIAVDLGP
jgi:alpha-L-fucosidase